MPVRCIPAPAGPPALEALHQLIDDTKDGDLLRRLTVVVPTNYVGLSIRRAIARSRGLAGVTFLTPYRLAELLGAAQLAAQNKRPVSTPVVAAAVRQVLAADAGMFADVVHHPSTERTLVRTHRELSEVSTEGLARLAKASRRAGEVVRIHQAVKEQLDAEWYSEHDLMGSATAVIEANAPLLADLGDIVIHLPQQLSNAAIAMFAALSERQPVTVIGGFTGNEKADTTLRSALDRLEVHVDSPTVDASVATNVIISTADADDEVRVAVRQVVEAARAGIPLERIAVLYGADRPYARQLHEQLHAAGVPFNGAAVRSIGESLVGQTLVRMLDLPDRKFRRDDLFTVLGSAALRDKNGRFVPTSAWERVSREAGILGGRDQWEARLGHLLEDLQLDLEGEQRTEGREYAMRRIENKQERTTELLEFFTELANDLEPETVPPTWRAKSAWAKKLIRRYIGGDDTRTEWPPIEIAAAEKVEAALERLSGLDKIEPYPSLAVFRRTLELELDSGLGREGRFGEGILVGPVSAAFGLDLDHVIIVGLAEGVFPSHPRDDSLLPDRERETVAGELVLRKARMGDQHRDFLCALAAARQGVVLCFPRGDLRRSTERMASRWLLAIAGRLAGEEISGEDLTKFSNHDWYTETPSFAGGLARLSFPATTQEYSLRSLFEHQVTAAPLADHHLAQNEPAFRRSIELTKARRSRDFTRFDGNLSHLTIPSPADEGVFMSPTRLEAWTNCPHRYLMQNVLRISEIERYDQQLRISPLDRGNIIHQALDEFYGEMIAEGTQLAYSEEWTETHRNKLQEIARNQCKRYEDRGLTGKAIFWERDKRKILRELDEFLTADNVTRSVWQAMPMHTELGFGVRDATQPAITVPLPDGRSVRFRGSIDRLDVGFDGSLYVTDYKTGNSKSYRELTESNPVQHGQRLQLPVYALAARANRGREDVAITVNYWFIKDTEKYKLVGYTFTDKVETEVAQVLQTIVENIERGVFPAHPDVPSTFNTYNCPYCDPDRLGTSAAYRRWERKKLSPQIDSYRMLVEEGKLV